MIMLMIPMTEKLLEKEVGAAHLHWQRASMGDYHHTFARCFFREKNIFGVNGRFTFSPTCMPSH